MFSHKWNLDLRFILCRVFCCLAPSSFPHLPEKMLGRCKSSPREPAQVKPGTSLVYKHTFSTGSNTLILIDERLHIQNGTGSASLPFFKTCTWSWARPQINEERDSSYFLDQYKVEDRPTLKLLSIFWFPLPPLHWFHGAPKLQPPTQMWGVLTKG